MILITDISQLHIKEQTAVTIGNFDGVHLGHQELIKTTRKRAKELNLITTVVTFDIHPHEFFFPESQHIQIIDIETKIELFSKFGVDLCVILPFKDIYNLTANEFITDFLIPKLNMKYLVEGSDFKFGKDNSCDIEQLKQIAKSLNFGLDILDRFSHSSFEASSTFIRKCLLLGQYKVAEKVLGHSYFPKSSRVAPPPMETNLKFDRV
jgi:riboflavin kinase / FMN adenylyltransferase